MSNFKSNISNNDIEQLTQSVTNTIGTVKSFDELRTVIGPYDGARITMRSYYDGINSGSGDYIWSSLSEKNDDLGLVCKPDSVSGRGRWELMTNGTLYGESYGLISNSETTPYSDRMINFFNAANRFNKVIFPNTTIYYQNNKALSFFSGTIFEGGAASKIVLMDKTKVGFMISGKTDIIVKHLTISTYDEIMLGGVGGGYVVFDNCINVSLDFFSVGPTAWDGVKFRNCKYIRVTNGIYKWNKSSAITMEGCQWWDVDSVDMSYNGRMSTNDDYAVPVPGLDSLKGRGITCYSSVQNKNYMGKIRNSTAIMNAEFNIRVFAESGVDGSDSIDIINNFVQDGGHPAGTYGTSIFPSKGADILVNSGTTRTTGIRILNNRIVRSFPYGNPVSVNSDDYDIIDNKVNIIGDAETVVPSFFLFGGVRGRLKGNNSVGASAHLSSGSLLPGSISIIGDIASDCSRFKSGTFSGVNYMRDISASHTSLSISPSDTGVAITDNWNISDSTFDGFYYGIAYSSGILKMNGNNTTNSIGVGFRNFSPSSKTVYLTGENNFDTISPNERANVAYDSQNQQGAMIGQMFTMPTQGYYKTGSYIFKTQLSPLVNGKRLSGWRRLTTGIEHTLGIDWEEDWSNTSS